MIPTIETIVEGLVAGTYTKQQAIGWLYLHAEEAYRGLRDDFAAAALQGMLAYPGDERGGNAHTNSTPLDCANAAYAYADAMLAERAK